MEITINYWAVIVCGIASLVIGSIWYGPIFGKAWMRLMGVASMDEAKRKEMQKKAMPMYFVQLLLSLFQAYVLAHYIAAWPSHMGTSTTLWLWLGFVMPSVAAAAMWTGDTSKVKWRKFLIQAGCNLVTLMVFALILSYWSLA